MRRAERPLNPEAVKRANAAISAETGGRPLTMGPEDSKLRKKWMDAYIAEAGDDSYADSKNQPPVTQMKVACEDRPKNWVELTYSYCDGSGVGGARYQVVDRESGAVAAEGRLDANGYAMCSLPISATKLTCNFDDDPPGDVYLIQPIPNPELRNVKAGWFERMEEGIAGAALWFWGAVAGDFNEDQTIGQIVVNSLITMIPIVDQVGDIRDIAANLKFLIVDKRYNDKWVWIALVLTLIGLIPVLGSAAKGVLKAIFHGLKTGTKIPLKFLIEILNKFFKGNAVAWLRKLAREMPSHATQAKRMFSGILKELRAKMKALAGYLPGKLRKQAEDAGNSIDEVAKVADKKIDEAAKELQEGLQKTIDEGADFTQEGAAKSKITREQAVAEPPPAPKPAPTKVKPSGGPLTGKPTEVTGTEATKRGLIRENEAAGTLSANGYTVHQNPPRKPNGKEPDYLIENEYFDCYSPSENKSLKGVWDEVGKKIPKQADRIVLNLDDWGGDVDELRKYFNDAPIEGLQEILVVQKGSVFPL